MGVAIPLPMAVFGLILRNEIPRFPDQIPLHVRIGILVHRQGAGGVEAPQVDQNTRPNQAAGHYIAIREEIGLAPPPFGYRSQEAKQHVGA